MTQENFGGPALLTVAEFLQLAAGRGKRLWVVPSISGGSIITDGHRRYALPDLPGGRLPSSLIESLCYRFDLPYEDFALDLKDDD